jgi:hypothetical protein
MAQDIRNDLDLPLGLDEKSLRSKAKIAWLQKEQAQREVDEADKKLNRLHRQLAGYLANEQGFAIGQTLCAVFASEPQGEKVQLLVDDFQLLMMDFYDDPMLVKAHGFIVKNGKTLKKRGAITIGSKRYSVSVVNG